MAEDIKELIEQLRRPALWSRHENLTALSAIDDAPFRAADALERLEATLASWWELRRAQEDTYIYDDMYKKLP